MTGAFVNDGLVFFAGGFQEFFRFGNGRVHSLVVFGVKAVNGTNNFRGVLGVIDRNPVERICGLQFRVRRRVLKRHSPAPAESTHGECAVARRNFREHVIGRGIEIGFDLLLAQSRGRFARGVEVFELLSAVQIGRDRDDTVLGQLVAQTAHPIG